MAVFFEKEERGLQPKHAGLLESDLRTSLTCTGFLLLEDTAHGWFPVMWYYDHYRLGLSLEGREGFPFDVLIGDPQGTKQILWGWHEDAEFNRSYWDSAWREWSPDTQEYGVWQFGEPHTIAIGK